MAMIPLTRFKTMDIYILVSAVNMQLRDEYSSLEDLCSAQEIPADELRARLEKGGFKYDPGTRQFK
ncbi:MAG: DUF4250 domain-containing protein [Succinivibrio sp.]|jgi:hypothetical protein|nr:DUF4250 domain-containing protein [Succinivibrio sp.]